MLLTFFLYQLTFFLYHSFSPPLALATRFKNFFLNLFFFLFLSYFQSNSYSYFRSILMISFLNSLTFLFSARRLKTKKLGINPSLYSIYSELLLHIYHVNMTCARRKKAMSSAKSV